MEQISSLGVDWTVQATRGNSELHSNIYTNISADTFSSLSPRVSGPVRVPAVSQRWFLAFTLPGDGRSQLIGNTLFLEQLLLFHGRGCYNVASGGCYVTDKISLPLTLCRDCAEFNEGGIIAKKRLEKNMKTRDEQQKKCSWISRFFWILKKKMCTDRKWMNHLFQMLHFEVGVMTNDN